MEPIEEAAFVDIEAYIYVYICCSGEKFIPGCRNGLLWNNQNLFFQQANMEPVLAHSTIKLKVMNQHS